ncbi:MAG: hypothetical protein IJQ57_11510 [Synergistaceae bacterium]|nr:hypothetical protein [Synergistaceae bacterium]
MKSIANDEKPNEEILYDQPKIDTKKIRVSGPFTVEALPAPVVFSPDEATNFETDSNEAAKHSDWSEQMKATGINGVHGEKLKFTSIELFSGTKWINAEAYTEEGKRAFISFANEYSLMDTNRVYKAYEEALKFPPVDMIIFAAFQFDPMAVEEIEELKKLNDKIELLQVNMNTDLLTQDLRRKAKTDSLFWFVGQPDISLEKIKDNSYRVKVSGFEYNYH